MKKTYERNANLYDQLMRDLQNNHETEETSVRFASIQSYSAKIDFIFELLEKYGRLPHYLRDDKDNQESAELRKKGNKLFVANRDEEALKMYTVSVAVAEDKTEYLGLAYANRSAVLFRLKLFEECLKDITRALQSKYPESLQPKLLERRKSAELLKLKQEKTPYHQEKPFIDEQNLNPLIECASNSVGIIFNVKLGRHIIATKDIEIGEVIAVEKPAFSALTDEKWCHCHHCLTLCYCLIPCESCTQALFCSDACKDNAKVYHNFECHILATISTLDIVPSRVLPLRISIIVKNGYQDIMSGCDDLSNEKLYRSGRYREIHNLVTNLESRSASNLFERVAMTAIFYYLVKQYTDFFKGEDEGCEDTFKTVLLHLLQVSACNFHEINETERNPLTQVYELKTVGAGAYSFLSLFNHSCAPNVGRICYGTTIVLLASESIKKGDQLFENYGYHHAMHSRAERRSALKIQYFFDCACRACENDWGTYDTLPQIDFDMSILMLNYEKLANADVETARKIAPDVKKVVKKLEKHIPCKNLCEAQELLKQCFSVHGNLRRMLKS